MNTRDFSDEISRQLSDWWGSSLVEMAFLSYDKAMEKKVSVISSLVSKIRGNDLISGDDLLFLRRSLTSAKGLMSVNYISEAFSPTDSNYQTSTRYVAEQWPNLNEYVPIGVDACSRIILVSPPEMRVVLWVPDVDSVLGSTDGVMMSVCDHIHFLRDSLFIPNIYVSERDFNGEVHNAIGILKKYGFKIQVRPR